METTTSEKAPREPRCGGCTEMSWCNRLVWSNGPVGIAAIFYFVFHQYVPAVVYLSTCLFSSLYHALPPTWMITRPCSWNAVLNIDRSFAVLTVAVNLYLLVIHRNSLEGVNVLAFLLAVASFVCYANQYRNYARYHLAWHITSEIGTLVLVAHLFE
jgi:hypothetical protein